MDQQLFNTLGTACTAALVFNMLNHKASFMCAHGQMLLQFLPPAGAPVDVHAQPALMPAITNSPGNFIESDEVHWPGDEHTNTFMGNTACSCAQLCASVC